MNNVSKQQLIHYGFDVLKTEVQALNDLVSKIDENFALACQHILKCQGHVIVTGIGKSGHIAKKIAATFASTGSPAFFMHPGEACHGDLGMLTKNDVVLAISNSGEADEILLMLPFLKRINIPIIAMTGRTRSQLVKHADVFLDIGVQKEACSLGLTPTASTTVTLALGDALAVSVFQARGFTSHDFARSHPAGRLGRRLLVKISDIMHTGKNVPKVHENATLSDMILEMSKKRLGMTIITQNYNPDIIIGLFTDGDLRRVFERQFDIKTTPVSEVMTKQFTTVCSDMLAAEAIVLMEQLKVNGFPVLDKNKRLVGAFNMHNLLQAGVI